MANEKRLIDADAEIEAIKKYACKDCESYDGIKCRSCWADDLISWIKDAPKVDAVEVEKYKALVEMYHDLRENFIDYVCSGTCNVAPYCLNRCEGCVDRVGWCSQGSDECNGFNPAEVIMDGDGNG
jgi:hypothetical protein